MKSCTHSLTILCLLFLCTFLTANDNYNRSMLYLSLPCSKSVKASLGEQEMERQGNVYIADGIAPGKYLLKVSQKRRFEPTVVTNSDFYELILYSGYIIIAPKKIVFAKVDAAQHLKITEERSTKTVSIKPLSCLEDVVCSLQGS